MRNLANFVLFQVGWFACVLGAADGRPWIGAAVAAALIAIHLAFVATDRRGEARLIALMTLGGTALSAFNVWNGAVDFAADPIEIAGTPLWIAALWALFATLQRHSLAWLQGRWLLAALFGLVGSPLSYAAAERMGAVTIHPDFARGPLVLGATWAIAVPLALRLARPQRDP